jgi:hypothetical protein
LMLVSRDDLIFVRRRRAGVGFLRHSASKARLHVSLRIRLEHMLHETRAVAVIDGRKTQRTQRLAGGRLVGGPRTSSCLAGERERIGFD